MITNQKENIYFIISVIVSVLIYLTLIFSIVGILYIILGMIIVLITHGLFIGNIKGNSIKVSEKQLPEIYKVANKLSKKIGLDRIPDIYVLESGGMLNAFATKFLGRNFIIVYSDVLELAYESGESAVEFILCHELAHIKCNHNTKHLFIYPAMIIPFLGTAYSRACEYTCDIYAATHTPNDSIEGLLILGIGKKLYKQVSVQEICNQVQYNEGFWTWFSEILSTHPTLIKRIKKYNDIKNKNALKI